MAERQTIQQLLANSLAAATLGGLGFTRAPDRVGGFITWVAAALPVEPA